MLEGSGRAGARQLPTTAPEPSLLAAHAQPAIVSSHARCAQAGLATALTRPLPPLAALPPLESTWAARHYALVRPAIEDLYQFIEGSESVVAFADADGRLVELVGDEHILAGATAIGFERASCWSEGCAGTNGLALALAEAFPIQVTGEAHYCALLHPFSTSGAPVHDSTGTLIGALVVLTWADQASSHTLAMVSAAASALTSEVRMDLWLSSANELLAELNAILQSLSEGIMLLQRDGTISQMNARAGKLLGLMPARVTGQRLRDVLDVPPALAAALQAAREMHDEEIAFRAAGTSVRCLCSLRAIAAATDTGLSAPLPATERRTPTGRGPHSAGGLAVVPRAPAARGYVVTLRSIDRVHRLVHRMSGAQARMSFSQVLGSSPGVLEALRLARIAAAGSSTVLLHGESGTGKEIFAQSIHSSSARAEGPFVAINCAAIPRELISSELFGYEGGAFTGADRHGRPGKFELADGGTLFLDEIGDMPRDLQTTLLRAIETRSVTRVGGQTETAVDVRIIAATHKQLADEVQFGNFRADLFFRLNVFTIEIPALRDRPEDVPLLLQHVLERLSTRLDRPLALEAEALAALQAYGWPGNVRELENTLERAVYVAPGSTLRLADLPDAVRATLTSAASPTHSSASAAARAGSGSGRNGLRAESTKAEVALIEQALRNSGGNLTEAARLLGIDRSTLWRKQVRYGLRAPTAPGRPAHAG
ncbi:MAG TPA: sigma 54-interacting transcriptional regulator [Ktedonobacterales bacterium]|nr:sigma 54-interacting transcriptional regulator [Ktedonobacterales bacterium]